MGLGIGNQLAQDDVALILKNPAVQVPTLGVFTQPYWPPGFSRDLYRPLTTLALGLQWRLSAGHPWVIHAVSLGLYVALTLAVWALARRILPASPAFIAALIFAVHPVHVEAVALGVNQAEIMVALILSVGMVAYVDARRAGVFTTRLLASLLSAFVAACLFKEHAIVFPVLLLAAELTVLRTTPWVPQVRTQALRLFAWLVILSIAFLLLRALVLQTFAGTFSAEALSGASPRERWLTMLGIVPIWLRLLLWPAHLQADYSPGEIVAATTVGPPQWMGLLLLAGGAVLLVSCWHRLPAMPFGLLWMAIAIGPVSNLLIVIGIVVAERTLLLPSVGFVLAIGASVALAGARWHRLHPTARRLGRAVGLCLVVLGIARSAERVRVWNSQDYLWKRTLEDAPKSYRAHYYAAQWAREHGDMVRAEQELLQAIAYWPSGFGLASDLGDLYRTNGMCEPAIVRYRESLEVVPAYSNARLSLVSCLLWVGSYDVAEREARLGRAWGHFVDEFANAMRTADSAKGVMAPVGTVRLPDVPGHALTRVGAADSEGAPQ